MLPRITSLSPNTGKTGDKIIITGRYFSGRNVLTACEFSGKPANGDDISDTKAYAIVPAGITGTVHVRVRNRSGWSNTMPFTCSVVDPPVEPPIDPPEPPVEPPTAYITSNPIILKSGDGIANRLWTMPDVYNDVHAVTGSGIQTASLTHVRFENLKCGAKIGSGAQSYSLTIDDVIARGCFGAFFFANVSASVVRNCDLECIFIPNAQSGSKNHVIYIERGVHNLLFQNVKMVGASSWPVHLYNGDLIENGGNQPSGGIVFDGLDVTCQVGAVVVSEGFDGVTIRNAKIRAGGQFPVFQSYGAARNVLVENFEAWGGTSLVGKAEGRANPVNWIFRNGIYHGPKQEPLPGMIFDNVTFV